MRVERLPVGPLDTNCFLVSDGEGGPVVVIDPGGEADRILSALDGREVAAVVLTHRHFDHLEAADEVRDVTGAPLMVHVSEADEISTPQGTGGDLFGFDGTARSPERTLADGDVVEAGGLRLSVAHTPGHSTGGITLVGPGHAFVGDLVFAGSVGRTDFRGGDARDLSRSIAERIATLPEDTVIHPGHGPDTTVRREKSVNMFFPRPR